MGVLMGHFLPDGAPLPSCVQVSPDDWSPYHNWLEFELAEFLFNQIDTLLEIWATSLIELGGNPLFANHTDLYHVIDSMSIGAFKWENFKIAYKCKHQDGQNADEQDELIKLAGLGGQDGQDGPNAPWMFDVYDVWYWDPHQDFMLGDWAWEEVDKIISVNPMSVRATLVPIILGSDKTTFSVATGQMDYYLLYLSIGNVCNTTCHVHHDAVVLIGFLAMSKTFHKFRKQLFHSSLACILHSLCAAMTVLETVLFSNQYYCHIIYLFTAYIADYEEQVLLSCIMHGWCLKCLAHRTDLDQDALQCCHEHTELIIKELDLQTLQDKYGIDGTIAPFTSEFPCVDIQRMLLLDILHQLIKGGFKDHLVDWVEKYLIHVHGRSAAEKILDDIDRRITAVTPFTGLQHFPQGQHFKQWTGDDSKGLMKVYIAAIEGYVPEENILTFSSFLEFCYLIHRNIITEPTLIAIEDALASFHSHLKWPYQHTNHFRLSDRYLGSMRGLINLLQHEQTSKNMDTDHNALNKQDHEGDGEELAASFEEDPGDMDDSPMSVKAHHSHNQSQAILDTIKMLQTLPSIELSIPQFHNILWYFLQSQLQHDDCDPEDVPLDECPFYDGPVHVYNSASSMFYAPSDVSSCHGMCHEHICYSPTWRNEGCHYDCVFVVTNPHTKGMLGLDVAHVLCFFSFKHLGTEYLCAIICWFDHIGDGPNNTGMWVVHMCNAQDIAIVHINTIYCTAQLIPVYASQHGIDPASIKPNESYDKFWFYYVNKFADHHAFEIAS
ncbi:hypothetical protein EDC04DRAFT_2868927 [Pisolithus marmoratus]|nr:hypothetical protein EDC04DRAFT_2868927 [Pisolithus marmoratus]